MTEISTPFRRATSADAAQMAELVNMAGGGLPMYVWDRFAQVGQTAWEVGLERARLGLGGFAFRHTVVRDVGGRVGACLMGYPMCEPPPPPPVRGGVEVPPQLTVLQELGKLAPIGWYLNVIATFPEHRGKGFATELLRMADQLAQDAECSSISLTMSDANLPARRLYEKHGYAELAQRAIVKAGWELAGENWVLMVKRF